jgi:predicted lipid-binding transport protein (Tim44 family)
MPPTPFRPFSNIRKKPPAHKAKAFAKGGADMADWSIRLFFCPFAPKALMPRFFRSLFLLICILTLIAPAPADARAGGGRSSGSRGGHTYQSMPSQSPYQARPIERSTTPQTAPRPTMGQMGQPAAPSPSFFGSHPFLSSLAGGFLGAGLFSALFGSSGMGGGGSLMGGAVGFLLQILLFGGLIFLAIRWFKGRAGASGTPFQASPSPFAALSNRVPSLPQDQPLTLTDADYQTFQSLLGQIQTGWGQVDQGALRACLTDEMQHYFSRDLAANTSRNLVNRVEQVDMLAGDLVEAWSEDGMDYATVYLKWSAIDYMARLDRPDTAPDYVAEGSRTVPTLAEEIWTFTRAQNGGHWILSAIQQVG